MADIEKTKATEAEKTEYAEPDMRPEKLIKQQEREAKMTPDELYAELKLALISLYRRRGSGNRQGLPRGARGS